MSDRATPPPPGQRSATPPVEGEKDAPRRQPDAHTANLLPRKRVTLMCPQKRPVKVVVRCRPFSMHEQVWASVRTARGETNAAAEAVEEPCVVLNGDRVSLFDPDRLDGREDFDGYFTFPKDGGATRGSTPPPDELNPKAAKVGSGNGAPLTFRA